MSHTQSHSIDASYHDAQPHKRLLDRLVAIGKDIKLSHTVFAMPFALLAAFLACASQRKWPDLATVLLIVLCMFLARTAAMALNRWADADLDALNPRTANRAIPGRRLSAGFVLGTAIACAMGFILATAGFWFNNHNIYPLILAPAVLGWLVAYSFTKRFTWLCHLYLGSALALSPLAATLAVEPAFLRYSTPYLLFVMVTCWVAGFDIIYALQDVESDRATGIFSMPANLGVEFALWVSRALHAAALLALFFLWRNTPSLGIGFAIGCLIVVGLLVLEHALVWGSRTHHIPIAFFTVNGAISLLLGILGIVDTIKWL